MQLAGRQTVREFTLGKHPWQSLSICQRPTVTHFRANLTSHQYLVSLCYPLYSRRRPQIQCDSSILYRKERDFVNLSSDPVVMVH